ncbi:MAG: M48 family metallopeptidase [Ruminiclostridium sp.]|nr:M48 family metallopeptidase [Ruminiclostridium sp.]
MQQILHINGRPIAYELTYKKVKNVNIRVRADGTVSVSAPQRVTRAQIQAILTQRGDFILGALEKCAALEQMAPKEVHYCSGDTLWLLGNPCVLTVRQGKKDGVERTETGLLLTLQDPENETLRAKTVETFYKDRCLTITTRLVRQIQPSLEPLGVHVPEVKVRSMTSRWGSCTPARKKVTFARQLIEAPLPCVEYVVWHELVHFVHPNHSADFYRVLDSFLPDWKARRELLNFYRYRQTP